MKVKNNAPLNKYDDTAMEKGRKSEEIIKNVVCGMG
jgi:hypothetical protein